MLLVSIYVGYVEWYKSTWSYTMHVLSTKVKEEQIERLFQLISRPDQDGIPELVFTLQAMAKVAIEQLDLCNLVKTDWWFKLVCTYCMLIIMNPTGFTTVEVAIDGLQVDIG